MERDLRFRATLEVIVTDGRCPVPDHSATGAMAALVVFLENQMLSGGLHSKFAAQALQHLIEQWEQHQFALCRDDQERAKYGLKVQRVVASMEARRIEEFIIDQEMMSPEFRTIPFVAPSFSMAPDSNPPLGSQIHTVMYDDSGLRTGGWDE